MIYFAYPVGHTLAEEMKVEFDTVGDAQAYCDYENNFIIEDEYDDDVEAWSNDVYAVSWEVFDENGNPVRKDGSGV